MKRFIFLFLFISFLIVNNVIDMRAQGWVVSGILDTSFSMAAGAADSPDFSCGVEEYANIRFQAKLRDKGTFYGAVNLFAAAGNFAAIAANLSGNDLSGYAAGQNYFTGIELERLYFRLNGEYTDFDCGLMRLPFGYSQVWGSSDFLNPPNPLKPDARPRGIIGTALSWYPESLNLNGDFKILGFLTAPRDPFSQEGKGWFIGAYAEKHWNKVSIQGLYSFEMPQDKSIEMRRQSSKYGIHRAGLSVKADIEAGFVLDALYTYNHEAGTELDGLSVSAGIDYSFFDGNLIVLAEYLYNGSSSSTALGFGGSFSNEHYLYTGFTWKFSDYTNAIVALISGLSDISFTPVISVNYDFFQGAVLTFSAQVPMDRDLFSRNGKRGELGPILPDNLQPLLLSRRERHGRYFDFNAKLRLRF